MRQVTVLVADPSPLLREILRTAFAAAGSGAGPGDPECTGTVATLAELRATCLRSRPSVLLSASTFPDGELLDALPELLSTGVRVLVLGTSTATEIASTLLFAGASGCLSVDDCGPAEVVSATRTVAAGQAALHPAVAAAVLHQWRTVRPESPGLPTRPAPPTLTAREADVLRALTRGLPTKTIARELSVSPKTIEAHISRLLTKLGARNRAHAISVAGAQGLLDR